MAKSKNFNEMRRAKLKEHGLLVAWLMLSISCGDSTKPGLEGETQQKSNLKQFELLPATETGITFTNDVLEDFRYNVLNYEYFYTGGGVAVGDLDNDGLPDLYFAGNRVEDKVYKNNGGFSFTDMTESSGLGGNESWSSGVTIIDVNQDGFNDIYVCRSWNQDDPSNRANYLYINNGDFTFTERAKEYGVDDEGFSLQATFFDYDLDGDLDLYVTNHPIEFKMTTEERFADAKVAGEHFRDKLFRNDGAKFTDVTKEAGVWNYGYGLGPAVGDLNADGWPDLYVANDYEEHDFYYLNNKDGTFTEAARETFDHMSFFAMGTDIADVNNDGHLDLVVLDMASTTNYRSKTNMASMNIPSFWNMVDHGRHFQYMRNTFQVNAGDGTFHEIAFLAGLGKTEWSWSSLFADFDNDGFKDLFVSNGYRRESRNVDVSAYLAEMIAKHHGRLPATKNMEILNMYPSEKINNYFYQNNGDLTFSNRTFEAGLNLPSFSQGAAYADLDQDGDLDLVVNNLLDPAFVYRNNAREAQSGNYMQFTFKGPAGNSHGIGTKVTIETGETKQYQELYHTRGYLSGVEMLLHFGLGESTSIDRVQVIWPDGKMQELTNLDANTKIELDHANASGKWQPPVPTKGLFEEVDNSGIDFVHKENEFDDFKDEILLPHKMSEFGPALSAGDVNGDGHDDLYIGGAAGQSGKMYLRTGNSFRAINGPWTMHATSEDVGATFFDADGDGDQDLYVVSGGTACGEGSPLLQDRLYLNNGDGKFSNGTSKLPAITASGSMADAADYDGDGDLDLFVGGRVVPGKYPFPARSYVLRNDGGTFSDVTADLSPDLVEPGMVTGALWTDVDGDNDLDLMMTGEWMPLTWFRNDNGAFVSAGKETGLDNTDGWWTELAMADMDGDGDMDFVAGNYGPNTKFKVSKEEPLHVYCHDFDGSGTFDIVLGYYNQGVCYPVRGRQCSSEQMPNLQEKFPTYHDFGSATLEDVYGENLQEALHYVCKTLKSVYIENKGGTFEVHKLPIEAQFSTIFGIIPRDVDDDGDLDLMITGNFYGLEIETGRNDAGKGLILINDGSGNFESLDLLSGGFITPGDTRGMVTARSNSGDLIIVAENNGPVKVFKPANSKSVAVR
jgi:hypothetical protein